MLSSSSSSTGRWVRRSTMSSSSSDGDLGLLRLFLFLERRAGGRGADLAFGGFAAFLAGVDLLGCRALAEASPPGRGSRAAASCLR